MKTELKSLIASVILMGVTMQLLSQTTIDKRNWTFVATKMPEEWYGSDESVKVAENVLLYQRDIGGWPKNTAMHNPLSEAEKAKINDDKGTNDAIFDNSATTAVVYIAGEGFAGISRRLTAWQIKKGVSLADAPIYVSHKAAAFGDPELMAHVDRAVAKVAEKEPVRLIIIDTWARNMVGDENSTMDTSTAIRAVDELRAAYGCTALIVHHSGQAESERARGSSALKAALDVEYKVSLQDDIMVITTTKMKDGEPPAPMTFGFDYVELGFDDEDGDPVISSALTPVKIDLCIGAKPLGKYQTAAVEILKDSPEGITEAALKERLEIKGNNRSVWKQTKEGLLRKNLIEIKAGLYHLIL